MSYYLEIFLIKLFLMQLIQLNHRIYLSNISEGENSSLYLVDTNNFDDPEICNH